MKEGTRTIKMDASVTTEESAETVVTDAKVDTMSPIKARRAFFENAFKKADSSKAPLPPPTYSQRRKSIRESSPGHSTANGKDSSTGSSFIASSEDRDELEENGVTSPKFSDLRDMWGIRASTKRASWKNAPPSSPGNQSPVTWQKTVSSSVCTDTQPMPTQKELENPLPAEEEREKIKTKKDREEIPLSNEDEGKNKTENKNAAGLQPLDFKGEGAVSSVGAKEPSVQVAIEGTNEAVDVEGDVGSVSDTETKDDSHAAVALDPKLQLPQEITFNNDSTVTRQNVEEKTVLSTALPKEVVEEGKLCLTPPESPTKQAACGGFPVAEKLVQPHQESVENHGNDGMNTPSQTNLTEECTLDDQETDAAQTQSAPSNSEEPETNVDVAESSFVPQVNQVDFPRTVASEMKSSKEEESTKAAEDDAVELARFDSGESQNRTSNRNLPSQIIGLGLEPRAEQTTSEMTTTIDDDEAGDEVVISHHNESCRPESTRSIRKWLTVDLGPKATPKSEVVPPKNGEALRSGERLLGAIAAKNESIEIIPSNDEEESNNRIFFGAKNPTRDQQQEVSNNRNEVTPEHEAEKPPASPSSILIARARKLIDEQKGAGVSSLSCSDKSDASSVTNEKTDYATPSSLPTSPASSYRKARRFSKLVAKKDSPRYRASPRRALTPPVIQKQTEQEVSSDTELVEGENSTSPQLSPKKCRQQRLPATGYHDLLLTQKLGSRSLEKSNAISSSSAKGASEGISSAPPTKESASTKGTRSVVIIPDTDIPKDHERDAVLEIKSTDEELDPVELRNIGLSGELSEKEAMDLIRLNEIAREAKACEDKHDDEDSLRRTYGDLMSRSSGLASKSLGDEKQVAESEQVSTDVAQEAPMALHRDIVRTNQKKEYSPSNNKPLYKALYPVAELPEQVSTSSSDPSSHISKKEEQMTRAAEMTIHARRTAQKLREARELMAPYISSDSSHNVAGELVQAESFVKRALGKVEAEERAEGLPSSKNDSAESKKIDAEEIETSVFCSVAHIPGASLDVIEETREPKAAVLETVAVAETEGVAQVAHAFSEEGAGIETTISTMSTSANAAYCAPALILSATKVKKFVESYEDAVPCISVLEKYKRAEKHANNKTDDADGGICVEKNSSEKKVPEQLLPHVEFSQDENEIFAAGGLVSASDQVRCLETCKLM